MKLQCKKVRVRKQIKLTVVYWLKGLKNPLQNFLDKERFRKCIVMLSVGCMLIIPPFLIALNVSCLNNYKLSCYFSFDLYSLANITRCTFVFNHLSFSSSLFKPFLLLRVSDRVTQDISDNDSKVFFFDSYKIPRRTLSQTYDA